MATTDQPTTTATTTQPTSTVTTDEPTTTATSTQPTTTVTTDQPATTATTDQPTTTATSTQPTTAVTTDQPTTTATSTQPTTAVTTDQPTTTATSTQPTTAVTTDQPTTTATSTQPTTTVTTDQPATTATTDQPTTTATSTQPTTTATTDQPTTMATTDQPTTTATTTQPTSTVTTDEPTTMATTDQQRTALAGTTNAISPTGAATPEASTLTTAKTVTAGQRVFEATFKISHGADFSSDLTNKSSPVYKELESNIQIKLESVFREEYGDLLLEVRIVGFRSGSVVVDYEVVLADTATEVTPEEVRETFLVALNETSNEFLPGIVVDKESVHVAEPQTGVPQDNTFPGWGIALIFVGVVLVIGAVGAVVLIRRRRHRGKFDISKYRDTSTVTKYHIPRARVLSVTVNNDGVVEMEMTRNTQYDTFIRKEMPTADDHNNGGRQVDGESVEETKMHMKTFGKTHDEIIVMKEMHSPGGLEEGGGQVDEHCVEETRITVEPENNDTGL
ncbi:MUC3A [Branchiostoma lanceolatum]|uniref:MUC3A protein n=1 Tax=Branchiostoma lanceolatum TaxID=7740 RepID=A0A8J9ZE44_BRALA|nr:MUC3A [Branchiostoma lanceolatum]